MTVCFYLGIHQPSWLATVPEPLFVSHRRLADRRTLPRRVGIGWKGLISASWALDSGGFSELSMFGEWRTTPAEYVAAVVRYDTEIGHLDWAAPQDWMCEPQILAKTRLTVAEHQNRTVANYLELCGRWAAASDEECPFMPVLQGWTFSDYHRHADAYQAAGVDLAEQHLVGLGSVCRRQGTGLVGRLVRSLSPWLALHAFGVKTTGLGQYGAMVETADSMAWSAGGRRVPGCTPSHANEANCLRYALDWRTRVIGSIGGAEQFDLFARVS